MCAKQGKAERAGSKKQAPATSKLAPSLAKRRQHNATEVKAVQGKARQFNSSHVNSIQLNSIQLKSSQSKSSQVKGRQPEAMHSCAGKESTQARKRLGKKKKKKDTRQGRGLREGLWTSGARLAGYL